MNNHKKVLAFAVSLLLCLNTAPTFAHADNEDNVNYDDQIMPLDTDEDNTDTDGDLSADGFIYTVDDDGFAHITGCTLTDTNIAIPETLNGITVTEIEAAALVDSKVEKIHIPASIEYISAENPFVACLNLTEITVDENNENYCAVDGILFSKDMKKLISYPPKKEGKSYTIPDGVEQLGIASIAETSLEEINVPDTVNEIGRHTFSFNENLKKTDLSGTTVEKIDVMTFANCTSLTEVILPESLLAIELGAFIGCESLAEIELPEGLEEVGQSAFLGTAMMSVRIPESVTNIGYCAFGYDINENTIDDFTIIGTSGSAAQTYATDTDSEYDIVNNFEFISAETYDAEQEYLAMNPVTSEDGEYEYSVLDDGTCALLFCVSMDSTINVPAEIDGYTVTEIYKGAFISNEATSIILPDTVKVIGEAVFSQTIESITIPAGCTEIQETSPFLNCLALKEVNVTGEGDGSYSSENGILYNKDKSTLIVYPIQKSDKSFTAPSSVKMISSYAFCDNEYLEEVDISGVEEIGNHTFEYCPKLKSVKLSENLTLVGNCAFFGCTSLESIRVYDKVETIGDYAFGYEYNEELAQSITNGESTATEPYTVIDGFKMYVEEDTLAHQYAQFCGIETVSNTTQIGGKNVDKNFIYVIAGVAGAVVIAVIGVITGKNIKKKKGKKQ